MAQMKYKQRGRAFWEATVKEFMASDLSQRDFSESRGLNRNTLKDWLKRLDANRNEALVETEFIEIVSTSPEISYAPMSMPMRLHLDGAVVEFSDLPPVKYVAELLREVTIC